jgi:hypothetical protein
MANARGRRNRCHLPLRSIAKGRVASSKLIIGPVSGVVATASAMEAPAVGLARSGWSKWRRQGRTLFALALASTHSPVLFFFFPRPTLALQKGRILVRIAVPIVMSRYDRIHVGYCNTCVGIREEEAYKMKRDGRSFEGMDPVHPSHRSITLPMQPYSTRSSYLPSRV